MENEMLLGTVLRKEKAMDKTMELCVPCAEKIKQGFELKFLRHSGKITCAECGKRRYGSLYELKKKGGGQR